MISEVQCDSGNELSLEKFCDNKKIKRNKCNVFPELSSLTDLKWNDVIDVMLLDKVRCYVHNMWVCIEYVCVMLRKCVMFML